MTWVAASAAILAGTPVGLSTAAGQVQPAAHSADPSLDEDRRMAKSLSRAFQAAAEEIGPSVVHITQERRVLTQRGFFDPPQERMAQVGAGSGVIVSSDGYILTNNHVIEGAERVQVKLADGRELYGRVVGTDPPTDLGVIKIEASDLTPASFGDSEALEVGEWVLAVGSPFGKFDNTVTAGIVSAKGRTGLTAATDERNEDFIQTDAAINPGNSGGPLVNLDGQVVGINSQIATRTGGSVGIGFAIPAAITRAVMDQLIASGRVQRGWVGIGEMAGLTPALAQRLGYSSTEGVVLGRILPGGPASKAGLQPGDVVVAFGGHPVRTPSRLSNAIAFTRPGTNTEVDIIRDGQGLKVPITVADRDDSTEGARGLRLYGFSVRTLPGQLAAQIGDSAVQVTTVEQLGPAASANPPLEPGDIIVSIGGNRVRSAGEFDSVIARSRDTIRLNVIRGRQRGYIDVAPRQSR